MSRSEYPLLDKMLLIGTFRDQFLGRKSSVYVVTRKTRLE